MKCCATERAPAGRPFEIIPPEREGIKTPPTLAELGIDYKTSSISQKLTDLPIKVFEQIRDGHATLDKVQAARKRYADLQAHLNIGGADRTDVDLRVCSISDLFAAGIRPDAVITEPPRGAEHLPLFSELALACVNVPLVAVVVELGAALFLPEILQRLRAELTYKGARAFEQQLVCVFCQVDDAFERAKARVVPGPSTLRPFLRWDEYFI